MAGKDKEKSKKAQEKVNKWSSDVTDSEKWHPPAGLFTQGPDQIAKTLKENSDSERQAVARLTFYMNRAGANLTAKDKARLESAKEKLHALYEKERKEKEAKTK